MLKLLPVNPTEVGMGSGRELVPCPARDWSGSISTGTDLLEESLRRLKDLEKRTSEDVSNLSCEEPSSKLKKNKAAHSLSERGRTGFDDKMLLNSPTRGALIDSKTRDKRGYVRT